MCDPRCRVCVGVTLETGCMSSGAGSGGVTLWTCDPGCRVRGGGHPVDVWPRVQGLGGHLVDVLPQVQGLGGSPCGGVTLGAGSGGSPCGCVTAGTGSEVVWVPPHPHGSDPVPTDSTGALHLRVSRRL